MTYRELPPDQFNRLAAVEWPSDNPRPTPDTARVIVAECDGEIVGYLAIQIAVMLEPVWIEPRLRRGLIMRRLFDCAMKMMKPAAGQPYMTHAADQQMEGYLARLGLERTGWVAYTGRV